MKKIITLFVIALLGGCLAAPARVVNSGKHLSGGTALPVGVKQAPPEGVRVATSAMPVPVMATPMADEKPAMKGTFYGYASYSPKGLVKGIDKIENGTFSRLFDDPINKENALLRMDYGFYLDGKYCGYICDLFFGTLYDYYFAEVDLATGKKVSLKKVDFSKGFMQIFCYNHSDGYIYGYGKDKDGDLAFLRAPLADPAATEGVKKLTADKDAYCNAMTYNPVDRSIYGMNGHFEFVKIAIDGTQTVLGKFADASQVGMNLTGLVYMQDDGVYYWDASYNNDASVIYSITPSGQFTKICDVPDNVLYSCFFTTVTTLKADVPAKPELVENKFLNGRIDGSLVYRLSDKFEDGKPLQGEVSWLATIDGEQPQQGKGQAGALITVNYENVIPGFHTFSLACTFNDKTSDVLSTKLFIGDDTPSVPRNVTLTAGKVTWEAVTTGVNSGYVDVENMLYEVFLNGKSAGITKETSLDVTIPTDIFVTAFQASVCAISKGIAGEKGISNKILSGKPLELPVKYEPTAEQAATMTVIDTNNDGNTWTYEKDWKALYSGYTSSAAVEMNDWIFMPLTKFASPNKYYTLTYRWFCREPYIYNKEFMEVAVCKSIEGTITPVVTIMEKTAAPLGETMYEHNFLLTEAGEYYIGFHAVSQGDMYGFFLRDINVMDLNITPDSPDVATGLKAEGGTAGALNATVSFTLPAKTISGNTIPSSTVLKAVVTGASAVEVTGAPGATVSATVPTVQGDNNIVIYVLDGDKRSQKSYTTVYTGVSKPLGVKNFKVTPSDDRLSAVLSWEAPEGGQNGGYINPADLTYLILEHRTEGVTSGWVKIGEVKEGFTYTYKPSDLSKQELYNVAVIAQNIAGDSPVTSASTVLGKLYDLPLEETINNVQEPFRTYPWLVYYIDGKPQPNWGFAALKNISNTIWPDNDNGAFGVLAFEANAELWLTSPYFSTVTNQDVTVEMTVYCGDTAAPFTVMAERSGLSAPKTVYTFQKPTPDADKLGKVKFTLPAEFNNQGNVRLIIYPTFPQTGQLFVMRTISVNGATSGLDAVETEDSCRILTAPGQIRLLGAAGADVQVCTIDGRVIYTRSISDNDCSIDVAPGIYIVRADDKVAKVLVR